MPTSDWRLWAVSEFCGTMPDGRIKPADRDPATPHGRVDAGGTVRLSAPRNGWLSLRLVVAGRGEFTIRCEADGIEAELFREFYHRQAADESLWLPDALVPIASGAGLAIPAPDNACPTQTVQGVWLDLFIPADANVGTHRGRVTLAAGGAEQSIGLAVEVLEVVYPDDDCIQMDHNCYVHSWLHQQYPGIVPAGDSPEAWSAMIPLIHKYHAMCFEHHGLFHHLGTTHSGKTWELYNPRVAGRGRDMHAVDWTWYDRHLGPLLDGSAFAGGRRRAAPIHSVYTAYTPSWPADYANWGYEGYEVELTNVLRDHDAHLRQRGWTKTIQEFFFNHKKRYRAFPWDGDEPRFRTCDAYWKKYRQIIDHAVGGSPVPWRLRMDASWLIRQHVADLAGVVDFWVCSTWADFWEAEITEGPMARGDVTWSYGSSVSMADCTAAQPQFVYRTWVRGFGGFERWLTIGIGADPWMASDGGSLAWFYPGTRFGIDGPIPTVRLKIQRNAVQDINLMDRAAKVRGERQYKDRCRRSIPIRLWRQPSPAMLAKPPAEWNPQVDVPIGHEPDEARIQPVDPQWWLPIRSQVLDEAKEVARG